MQWILFAASLATGGVWMIGEHAIFWLGIEAAALTDHRGKLGLVFLLIVTALLVATFAKERQYSRGLPRHSRTLAAPRARVWR
jgi:hypothetical protein